MNSVNERIDPVRIHFIVAIFSKCILPFLTFPDVLFCVGVVRYLVGDGPAHLCIPILD